MRLAAASCLLAALLLHVYIPPAKAQRRQPTKRYNVLFIISDDLRPELGAYGHSQIKTPNIDRLAAQGMRFTRFYSGGTVCAPSRSVLMT
ncbi:MAG TPA: sulfatase-like hydrolase/transferase, partial [Pyrinomonadaceae bacterium]|nr:sulfatase-like hydrolase/transferase [Pyrinomonadaceae bacterium]